MNDSKWERYGALGGVLFVILILVSGLMTGSPPDLDASAKEITKWINDHGSDIRVSAYIGTLAIVPALWWLGSLWRALRRAEGGQPRLAVGAALGLLFGGAMVTISTVLWAALSLRITGMTGAEIRFVYLLSQFFTMAGGVGIAVLVGAVGAVILRSGVFPRWLGLVSAVLAVAWLVATFGITSDKNTFLAVGFVSYLVWSLWLLVLSILMYKAVPETS